MSEFVFSLEKNTYLREISDNYYLLAEVPLRIIRLNKSLFTILDRISKGHPVSEIVAKSRNIKEDELLRNLLSLTAKGYLKLEKTAVLKEYPPVTVVIPVKDVRKDIRECLESLSRLNYPQDKLEILVIEFLGGQLTLIHLTL